MKYLLLVFTIAFFQYNSVICQNNLKDRTSIDGIILYDRLEDTIVFSNYYIPSKFYEISYIEARVMNSKFKLDTILTYPQLYTMNFYSERGKIPYWGGDFFLDQSTTTIAIDSIGGCSEVNGKTYLEYKNRFLPFMMDGNKECKLSFIEFLRYNDADFDNKLLQYTNDNPDSFVALWSLIKIINSNGHSLLYENILNSFSEEMKKNHLWKLLEEDLASIRLKENVQFPVLNLKDPQLVDVKLELPKAKYILVDYWFHNCRPCIENFPRMKELYKAYQSKGFEIIGISVDRTKSISKWQEKVKDLELNWVNYLDENELEAKKDKINSYPTTFLLNDKGQIIAKNIDLAVLEEILKTNL